MIEGRTQNAPWVRRSIWIGSRQHWHTSSRRAVRAKSFYRAAKRAAGFVMALAALLLLSPVLAAIAIAIKLDSPGPVIFSQERMGERGRKFTCYKFRSMYHNHGKERDHRDYTSNYINGNHKSDGVYKPANGDVVTRVGRFLRRTSLDELPQLYNILKGEMAFVGPRPLVTYELEVAAPWHQRRLEAMQGLTGLVQVSGRSRLTFDEIVKLDLYYIEHSSLWFDLKILLKTIPAVLSDNTTC